MTDRTKEAPARSALKLALVKIRAAQMCHPNAVMVLIDEAEEVLAEALAEESSGTEQPAQDNTYGYAKSLAETIFKQHFARDEHYASGRIVWEVNNTVIGILTQIDNMVADMVRRPAIKQDLTPEQPAQQEPVAKDDADIYEFWARNKETEKQQKPMAYGMWDTMLGKDHRMMMVRLDKGQDGCTIPLYTSPPAQQEPVAWISKHGVVYPLDAKDEVHPINELQPLYTSQPANANAGKPWVGLTDEERTSFVRGGTQFRIVKAIEAKLKEKNT